MRLWLSAIYWNFPQGNSWKVLTFLGLPCGRHAFQQYDTRKVLTFHRLSCRKACLLCRIIRWKFWLSADFTMGKPALTQNNSPLHAFPRIIPRKGMLFRDIIRGKFWLSENYAPERHAFPRYNAWKVLTFCGLSAESQTSCTNISANSRKNIKQFLDVHQGPIGYWLMKKNKTKKSHATVPLNTLEEKTYWVSLRAGARRRAANKNAEERILVLLSTHELKTDKEGVQCFYFCVKNSTQLYTRLSCTIDCFYLVSDTIYEYIQYTRGDMIDNYIELHVLYVIKPFSYTG